MTNIEIIDILNDIARLLRLKRESIFKIRAYENAVKYISETNPDLRYMVKQQKLREIPGIGVALEKKITELVTSGKLNYYERLKSEIAEVKDDRA